MKAILNIWKTMKQKAVRFSGSCIRLVFMFLLLGVFGLIFGFGGTFSAAVGIYLSYKLLRLILRVLSLVLSLIVSLVSIAILILIISILIF